MHWCIGESERERERGGARVCIERPFRSKTSAVSVWTHPCTIETKPKSIIKPAAM